PGLEPVLKQQLEIFEFAHDSVKISVQYKTDKEMLDDLRQRKAQVLVTTRMLEEAEKEALKEKDTVYIREITVAHDAVALIGNRKFDDKALDVEQLKTYFNPNNKGAASPR